MTIIRFKMSETLVGCIDSEDKVFMMNIYIYVFVKDDRQWHIQYLQNEEPVQAAPPKQYTWVRSDSITNELPLPCLSVKCQSLNWSRQINDSLCLLKSPFGVSSSVI